MSVNDLSSARLAQVTGPLEVAAPDMPETLLAYIAGLIETNPEGAFVEVQADGEERRVSYAALWAQACDLAAHIDHVSPDRDRFVILCCESVLNYVPAAWACLMNGFSILPLSMSGYLRNPAMMTEKLQTLLGDHGAFAVLTETQFMSAFEAVCGPSGVEVHDVCRPVPDDLKPHADHGGPQTGKAASVFVETSGTTGRPKLARLDNAELVQRFFGGFGGKEAVNIALLGQGTIGGLRLLLPMGAVSIFLDPGRMMADPCTWLDLVVRFGVSHIGLSNSMAAKLNEWFDGHGLRHDLSSIKKIYFGSEMIVPDNIGALMDSFHARGMTGATASLVYSMTETGPLFVTTMASQDIFERCRKHDGFFCLDQCFTSWTVRVVNDDNELVEFGEVGSVQAHSTTRMFRGYHGEDHSFVDDGWFDTGDLGVLDEHGLVLTGRKKSTIIVNARKISTEAIELELSGIEGIRPGLLAAIPYRDAQSQTDELAIFYAPVTGDGHDPGRTAIRIRGLVAKSFGLNAAHLVAMEEDRFPRTPSGKIRRAGLASLLREGHVERVEQASTSQPDDGRLDDWIRQRWQQVLKSDVPPRDDSNIFEDGGDSLAVLQMVLAVEDHFQCKIPLESFYQSPTLGDLRRLAMMAGAPPLTSDALIEVRTETEDVLQKLKELLAPWVGPRPGPEAMVIGRNLSGRKPPIFWVFQTEVEFNALAEALGEDQPLYGMRSLVGIYTAQEYDPFLVHQVALRLLRDITTIHGDGPFVIGGNCQGAIIALHLARELRRVGREPQLLVLMEWLFEQGKYACPTLLLYGQGSHTRPYYEGERTDGPDWKSDFPVAAVEQISGQHGQFFAPDNIETLAGHLTRYCDDQAAVTNQTANAGDQDRQIATKIERIVMHWTGGHHTVSGFDRDHYHEIVSGTGERVLGKFRPEDNLDLRDEHFARHTKNLNVGTVGLSMACMLNARERPLDLGDHPMMEHQLNVFCKVVAEYCVRYDVPVLRETVLSHAEVQPTLSVKQAGKWDITVLPGMDVVGDPVEIGDQLRDRVRAEIRLMVDVKVG